MLHSIIYSIISKLCSNFDQRVCKTSQPMRSQSIFNQFTHKLRRQREVSSPHLEVDLKRSKMRKMFFQQIRNWKEKGGIRALHCSTIQYPNFLIRGAFLLPSYVLFYLLNPIPFHVQNIVTKLTQRWSLYRFQMAPDAESPLICSFASLSQQIFVN